MGLLHLSQSDERGFEMVYNKYHMMHADKRLVGDCCQCFSSITGYAETDAHA